MLEKVPSDFYKWVMLETKKIKSDFKKTELRIIKIFNSLPTDDRNKFSSIVLSDHKKYSKILFKMLDKKNYNIEILNLVKPKKPARYFKKI
jgi:hypothetical protein